MTDSEQITEVIDVLLSLCERASKSKMAKRLSGIDWIGDMTSLCLISHFQYLYGELCHISFG